MSGFQIEDSIRISSRKMKSLARDALKSAELIKLVYVSGKEEGIRRVLKDNKFVYFFGKRQIHNRKELDRIKSLVLPPAWTEVWICPLSNGHLQAVGLDSKNRKQYRYHPLWNEIRKETKYFQLYDFGKSLPEMRRRINSDLSLSGMPREKVLAAIVSLMLETGMRIGNDRYEKLYGSFGLSTLKNRHVQINGNSVRFSFKGKKGVYQDISLKSRKLAAIISKCREIPGKELFQYFDENGEKHSVDSGTVNNYIENISGRHFTSKDFRTWNGSLLAIKAFISLGYAETAGESRKKINEAFDITARQLGNTRNVCRKHYVHPIILEHYQNRNIEKFFDGLSKQNDVGYSPEEQILLKMLEQVNKAPIKLSI